MRSTLYRLARWIGDYRAMRRGRYTGRLANKVIGRRVVGRMWR